MFIAAPRPGHLRGGRRDHGRRAWRAVVRRRRRAGCPRSSGLARNAEKWPGLPTRTSRRTTPQYV